MADTHRGRGANARDSETVLSTLGPARTATNSKSPVTSQDKDTPPDD
jgi:hypothetical protein